LHRLIGPHCELEAAHTIYAHSKLDKKPRSRIYIGETGRSLATQLREHKHNFKEGLIEKSKLAQHAYEEGHRVIRNKARILEIDPSSQQWRSL
jgi:hypothetical protein